MSLQLLRDATVASGVRTGQKLKELSEQTPYRFVAQRWTVASRQSCIQALRQTGRGGERLGVATRSTARKQFKITRQVRDWRFLGVAQGRPSPFQSLSLLLASLLLCLLILGSSRTLRGFPSVSLMPGDSGAVFSLYRSFRRQIRLLPTAYLRYDLHSMCRV